MGTCVCQVYVSCPVFVPSLPQTGDESNPSAAVEEILVTPDKLRDLDLDAFAEELERQVCVCVCVCV